MCLIVINWVTSNIHVILKAWNLIISKDRVQKQKETDFIPSSHHFFQKRKAIAASIAAVVKEWNVKDRPYQALS